MKVVSNSSPLVNLSRIGRLSILKHLYGTIFIPGAVFYEVATKGSGMPGSSDVVSADWIVVRRIIDETQLCILNYDLDPGESESIVLSIQEAADLLIMDERMGREKARHLGLAYTGTVGVLVEAKAKGLIDQVLPVIEELRLKAGFRLSESLVDHVGKSIGEDR